MFASIGAIHITITIAITIATNITIIASNITITIAITITVSGIVMGYDSLIQRQRPFEAPHLLDLRRRCWRLLGEGNGK